MGDFENLKDDNSRLNEHTKAIVEQLSEQLTDWTKHGYDGRALYTALSVFHDYYYRLGKDKLGQDYMNALEEQAAKLARELSLRKGL